MFGVSTDLGCMAFTLTRCCGEFFLLATTIARVSRVGGSDRPTLDYSRACREVRGGHQQRLINAKQIIVQISPSWVPVALQEKGRRNLQTFDAIQDNPTDQHRAKAAHTESNRPGGQQAPPPDQAPSRQRSHDGRDKMPATIMQEESVCARLLCCADSRCSAGLSTDSTRNCRHKDESAAVQGSCAPTPDIANSVRCWLGDECNMI